MLILHKSEFKVLNKNVLLVGLSTSLIQKEPLHKYHQTFFQWPPFHLVCMVLSLLTLSLHIIYENTDVNINCVLICCNYAGLLINIAPLNCNSMSQGACVINIKREQPVTLCTTIPTAPSVIPPGKHIVRLHESHWLTYSSPANGTGLFTTPAICLYKCLNGSCHPCTTSKNVNFTNYSDVNDSCLTIKYVAEKEMRHYFFLQHSIAREDHILQGAIYLRIQFLVTKLIKPTVSAIPTTTSTTTPTLGALVAISVSSSIITIVTIIIIVSLSIVFATIVKRYKRSYHARPEVDVPLQRFHSSR